MRNVGKSWLAPLGLGALVGILALGAALAVGAAGGTVATPPAARTLTGQFLVATDELQDPRFTRTVIYMLNHDATGAMGLVVNRPFRELPLAFLLERLGLESQGVSGSIRVHYGGPVEPGRAFILHTTDYTSDGGQVLGDGIALAGQPDILRAIGTGAGPRRALLTLGYAGWAPGQLEAEIAAGAWATVPADAALIFDDDHEKKWERAMARRRLDL